MEHTDSTITSAEEINLVDYFIILKKRKKLILGIVAVSVIITAIVSLLMTKVYEAKAVIAPVEKKATSGLSAIAEQFGVGQEASSVTEVINLLNSNILREKVLKKYKLQELFFKKSELEGKSENEMVWQGLRYLKKNLTVNYNKKENAITVSMQFEDPKIAAEIVNDILVELTEHMSSETKRVAEANKKYLESVLNETADPYVKANIYNLIVQQIQQAMMAEAKENFAFKVLDPPKVPDKRVSPKRAQMVILSLVASLFLGIFVAFFKEYLEKTRRGQNGKNE